MGRRKKVDMSTITYTVLEEIPPFDDPVYDSFKGDILDSGSDNPEESLFSDEGAIVECYYDPDNPIKRPEEVGDD